MGTSPRTATGFLRAALVCLLIFYGTSVYAASDVWVLAMGVPRSFDRSLPELRYANDDAERFAGIMQSVGAVPQSHITLLTNGSQSDFFRAVDHIKEKMRLESQTRQQTRKFIFYFSGHSDEEGLHLEDGRLRKSELHQFLESLPVDTKIAFLDSCFSGALASKGVVARDAIEIPEPEIDEPTGTVFITASSAKEMAFESREMGGSIFTHYLVSGLLGAADSNGDGAVTVDELYQYVYQQTRVETTLNPGAHQHPEVSQQIHGRGAVVLTVPKVTSNRELTLTSDLSGNFTIGSTRGLNFYKAFKEKGQPLTIRLPAGIYQLRVQDPKKAGVGIATLDLSHVGRRTLGSQDLRWVSEDELLAAKGDERHYWLDLAVGYNQPIRDAFSPGPQVKIGGRMRLVDGDWLDWQLAADAIYHSNPIHSQGNTADTTTLELLLGPVAIINTGIGAIHMTAAAGPGQIAERWHGATAQVSSTEGGPAFMFTIALMQKLFIPSISYEMFKLTVDNRDTYLKSVTYGIGLQF